MSTKFALLRLLNNDELIEIAASYGFDGSTYYHDTLADMIADEASKREVLDIMEYYLPDYLDYEIDERRKTTYIYALKNGHEIVYYGISFYPHERVKQHAKTKYFTNYSILNGPMTRENAELMEWDYITHYQDTHRGRPPRYNQNKVYK